MLVALIRGFARRQAQQVGNFYVDMTRGTLYILLPLSVLLALVLISQGVVQNFSAYQTVDLVEPVTIQSAVKDAAGQPVVDAAGNAVTQAEQITQQTIPLGPAASQVAIKQLGTNGGGFFNVNSAHPLENPTPLTNFLEVLAILLIPAALCYTFGRMVKDTRQGWACVCGDDDHLPAADLRCLRRRAVGQSAFGNIGRRSGQLAATRRRQHGRQGSALRHRQLGVVGCGHDGCIERIGQLDA